MMNHDGETEAYMNGELSWEDYLFKKRNVEQGRLVYSPVIRIKSNDTDTNNNAIGGFRQLSLKQQREGVPLSSYLLFGKAPEAPRQWANPQMEKLGSSVCEHNPMTKFAHAKAKLLMLTYVEAEMDGCRKRASDRWIKITKMNVTAFQPPCRGAQCCKVADMVSDQMVCDGGGVAFPTCDTTTCKWKYDCASATFDDDDNTNITTTNKTATTTPRSVYYRKYGARESASLAFNGESEVETSNGLTLPAKIGIGVGAGVGAVGLVMVVVVLLMKVRKSRAERA